MKIFIMFMTLVVSFSASATEFKCYASKFPSDMNHFFADGYTILNVSKTMVNLKYYDINTVANETTLEIEADYKLNGIQSGRGALKGMVIGNLVDSNSFPGDPISRVHFSPTLLKPDRMAGIVGKFAFPGHGFSYDWNVCYKN